MPVQIDETEDFDFIIELVYARTRIRLHEGKQALIRARLGKRMRHFGHASLREYCDLLRGPQGEEEMVNTIDALTTNFTHFMREESHFHLLVQEVLPALLGPAQKRIRLWSAACATGEEPYSMAIHMAEKYPAVAGWDWNILATDVSTKALGKAQQGIYAADRVNNLPTELLRRYFQRGHGDWEGHFRIKPSLAEHIRFEQLNLLGSYSFAEPFQAVFCRNVMIYFDRQTQEQLARQITQFLVPKGYLMIGHSESLTGLNVPLRCLRPSVYQKI